MERTGALIPPRSWKRAHIGDDHGARRLKPLKAGLAREGCWRAIRIDRLQRGEHRPAVILITAIEDREAAIAGAEELNVRGCASDRVLDEGGNLKAPRFKGFHHHLQAQHDRKLLRRIAADMPAIGSDLQAQFAAKKLEPAFRLFSAARQAQTCERKTERCHQPLIASRRAMACARGW